MKIIFLAITFIISNQTLAKNRACVSDLRKYCNEYKGNNEGLLKCFQSHQKDLSNECKLELKEAKQTKLKDLRKNCTEDAKKLCLNIKPGKGVIIKCLKDHEDLLSPNCKDIIGKN